MKGNPLNLGNPPTGGSAVNVPSPLESADVKLITLDAGLGLMRSSAHQVRFTITVDIANGLGHAAGGEWDGRSERFRRPCQGRTRAARKQDSTACNHVRIPSPLKSAVKTPPGPDDGYTTGEPNVPSPFPKNISKPCGALSARSGT